MGDCFFSGRTGGEFSFYWALGLPLWGTVMVAVGVGVGVAV